MGASVLVRGSASRRVESMGRLSQRPGLRDESFRGAVDGLSCVAMARGRVGSRRGAGRAEEVVG